MDANSSLTAKMNFDERPFVAIWETTQACDLACVHCRASAKPGRNPLELSTSEAKRLIDEIAAMEVPVFVLTGGDPLKRPDIFELVRYASEHHVRISLTPSATPLLTRENIVQLKQCGLARLAVSLDGPAAEIHDAFRRVKGSYEWTLNAVKWAGQIGLPVQINTTITRHNLSQLDDTIALLETLDIVLWSVFFLVPTGRGQSIDLISAEEFEQVFQKLTKPRNACCSTSRAQRRSTIAAFCCSGGPNCAAWDNGLPRSLAAFLNTRRCRWAWKPRTALAALRVVLMMAKASSSFRILERCFPADFCRSLAATFVNSRSARFIATHRYSAHCATART
jgi:MoaA/NifB/PqqE/SkfB family radical SAM enzyme